jgi:predicted nucleotidyltransferase
MLVGATARDIALAAEGHDVPLRATNDVDIAVVVADAAALETRAHSIPFTGVRDF